MNQEISTWENMQRGMVLIICNSQGGMCMDTPKGTASIIFFQDDGEGLVLDLEEIGDK